MDFRPVEVSGARRRSARLRREGDRTLAASAEVDSAVDPDRLAAGDAQSAGGSIGVADSGDGGPQVPESAGKHRASASDGGGDRFSAPHRTSRRTRSRVDTPLNAQHSVGSIRAEPRRASSSMAGSAGGGGGGGSSLGHGPRAQQPSRSFRAREAHGGGRNSATSIQRGDVAKARAVQQQLDAVIGSIEAAASTAPRADSRSPAPSPRADAAYSPQPERSASDGGLPRRMSQRRSFWSRSSSTQEGDGAVSSAPAQPAGGGAAAAFTDGGVATDGTLGSATPQAGESLSDFAGHVEQIVPSRDAEVTLPATDHKLEVGHAGAGRSSSSLPSPTRRRLGGRIKSSGQSGMRNIPPRRGMADVDLELPRTASSLAAGVRALAAVETDRPRRTLRLGFKKAAPESSSSSSDGEAFSDTTTDSDAPPPPRPARPAPPSTFQRLRMSIARATDSTAFDNAVILCILVNCAFLAAMDPTDARKDSARNVTLFVAELVFQSLFTAEMALKIFGHGLFRQNTGYLRSAWNCIDGLLVFLGWVAVAGVGDNISAVRVIRIMRPLRRMQSVPGLRLLIDSMLASMPQLMNVMGLCAFIFLVFGIIGVQLFKGSLNQRCHFMWPNGTARIMVDPELEGSRLCSLTPGVGRQCEEQWNAEAGEWQPTICAHSDLDQNRDITSFDNTAVAFLTIFQCISLEGWVDVMYWISETDNRWSNLYFVLLILFGSLFLLNLVVAVITLNLTAKGKEERVEARAAKWIAAAERTAQSASLRHGDGPQTADILTALVAAKYALRSEDKEDEMAKKLTTERRAMVTDETAKKRAWRRRFSRRELWLMDHAGFTERQIRLYRHKGLLPPPKTGAGFGFGTRIMDADSSDSEPEPEVSPISGWFFSLPTRMSPDYVPPPEPPSTRGRRDLTLVSILLAKRVAHRFATRARAKSAARALAAGADATALSFQDALIAMLAEARSDPRARDQLRLLLNAGLRECARQRKHDVLAYGLDPSNPPDPYSGVKLPSLLDDARRVGFDGTMVASAGSASAAGSGADAISHADSERSVDSAYAPSARFGLVLAASESNLSESSGSNDGRNGTVYSGSDIDDDVEPIDPFMPTESSPQWRWTAYTIVQNEWFTFTIVVLIVLNTLMLSIEHKGMEEGLKSGLETGNLVLTALFTLELVVKLLGLGVEGYLSDNFNLFDAFIVVVSILEVVLQDDGAGVSALRSFRLMRVFKLARSWNALNELLVNMGKSGPRIWPFSIVLAMFMFIFALLGMQTFGGRFKDPDTGEVPRAHFDTLLWALVTVFQIITGENWNEVMYDGVLYAGWGAVAYFIVLVVTGSYIVLNLFLGILIDSFCSDDDDGQDEYDADRAVVEQTARDLLEGNAPGILAKTKKGKDDLRPQLFRSYAAAARRRRRLALRQRERLKAAKRESRERHLFSKHASYKYKAFNCLHADQPVRKVCGWLALRPEFDGFILLLIALSCILLALESPSASVEAKAWIEEVDLVVTLLFTTEMVVKLIAFGCYSHPGAYFKDSWNVLDGIIVIISLINIAFGGGLGAFKVLRALRALRPLRVIRRMEGLRLVVHSVMKAVPPVLNLGVIALLFFLVFGILGTNFFGGKLGRCNDDARLCEPTLVSSARPCPSELACVGTFLTAEGVNETRAWVNPSYAGHSEFSFDNVAAAMLSLFEVASMELWLDIMYACVDISDPGWAPERDANELAALFFVVFIVISSLFILNLFVSVVVDNFSKAKEEMVFDGSLFMTPGQRKWVEMQRVVLSSSAPKVVRPSGRWRGLIFDAVVSSGFEFVIMGFICLNMVSMACRHYEQGPVWHSVLDTSNLVFGFIFVFEMAFKLIGLGCVQYWSNPWNIFDGTVVILSAVDTLVSVFAKELIAVDLTILRVIRVARVFRLVKTSASLRALFTTLAASLPSLVNVGTLLLLLFFVYAIAGMHLFGDLEAAEFLNEHANFNTFLNSMLVVYRMSTGESWNGIMHDCMAAGTVVTVFYFTSFVLLGQFIMLNLFVAVILENFEREMAAAEDKHDIRPDDIERFAAVWQQVHPRWSNTEEGRGYDREWLPAELLPSLIKKLDPPLGLDKAVRDSKAAMMRLMRIIDVPINRRGEIYYGQTLRALVRRVCGEDIPTDVDEALHGLSARLPPQLRSAMASASGFTAAQLYAAELLQSVYAERLHRKRRAHELAAQRSDEAKRAKSRVATMLGRIGEEEELSLDGHQSDTTRQSHVYGAASIGDYKTPFARKESRFGDPNTRGPGAYEYRRGSMPQDDSSTSDDRDIAIVDSPTEGFTSDEESEEERRR